MIITDNFDGGNILVIDSSNPQYIRLAIRKDTNAESLQWFYFRLTGAQDYPCQFYIENAAEVSFPEWDKYQVRASYDRQKWFTVPTQYDGKRLNWHLKPSCNSVFFAMFAPFSYEQHLNLLHQAQENELCVLDCIGFSPENRSMDMLTVGYPGPDKKKVWIIARQHPGEPMAEWFIQGLLQKLLNPNDPVAREILAKAVCYIVPNVNPDGSIAGNLRTNTRGTNLNREWLNPSAENSPEILAIEQKMRETGVDLFLDIHGDEGLPYNFVSGTNGIPNFSDRLLNLQNQFMQYWMDASPEMQLEFGYPVAEPGKANINIASKWVAHTYNCLSYTIEMPFKDNANMPMPETGWSAERSMELGASVLDAVRRIMDKLR